MAYNTNYLDEIFDGLGEAINEITNGVTTVQKTVDGYATVKKNSSTGNINKDVTSYINSNIQNKIFSSRYEAFNAYVDNVVTGNFDDETRNGFDTAIKHYKEILNKSMDFKHLETQIISDLSECYKKANADKYLNGYYQGLLILKKIINESKMACFRKFANKFD